MCHVVKPRTQICTFKLIKFTEALYEISTSHNVVAILVQQDNARSHTRPKTQEWLKNFWWAVLPHPPCSPDLAASDFHLLGAPKDVIRGERFESHDEVIEEVKKCGCEYNIQPGTRRGQRHLVLAGARLLKLEIYRKIRCVIHTFGILPACP